MNLIVDIGNTSTKLAVFEGTKKLSQSRISELSCEELEDELTRYKIDKVIISSVKKIPLIITELFLTNISYVHILSDKSLFPFKIEYDTPETPGCKGWKCKKVRFGDYRDFVFAGQDQTCCTYKY